MEQFTGSLLNISIFSYKIANGRERRIAFSLIDFLRIINLRSIVAIASDYLIIISEKKIIRVWVDDCAKIANRNFQNGEYVSRIKSIVFPLVLKQEIFSWQFWQQFTQGILKSSEYSFYLVKVGVLVLRIIADNVDHYLYTKFQVRIVQTPKLHFIHDSSIINDNYMIYETRFPIETSSDQFFFLVSFVLAIHKMTKCDFIYIL